MISLSASATPHGASFDAWKTYELVVDSKDRYRVADGEMRALRGRAHSLSASVAGFSTPAGQYPRPGPLRQS
jgi:hypothetical protein